MLKNKRAFTLAEVLITLGILGIVIAMTLPGLITKYKRNVAENKLQKFYSTINQALNMGIAEYGEIEIADKDKVDFNNSEYISSWMKKYITKYLQTLKSEKVNERTYEVALSDGSGFTSMMYPPYDATNTSHLYIFYCLDFNKCNANQVDGKNTFWFAFYPDYQTIAPLYSMGPNTPQNLKNNFCYNEINHNACATIIMQNGWKIPKDYPWIK